jgi:hypothetical protein
MQLRREKDKERLYYFVKMKCEWNIVKEIGSEREGERENRRKRKRKRKRKREGEGERKRERELKEES